MVRKMTAYECWQKPVTPEQAAKFDNPDVDPDYVPFSGKKETSSGLTTGQWQDRVDKDFPSGAVVEIVDSVDIVHDGQPFTFRTTGLTIVGVRDSLPLMRFCDADGSNNDWFLPIVKYEVDQTEPCLVVRVTGPEGYATMRFGGGFHHMGPSWAQQRDWDRETILALS